MSLGKEKVNAALDALGTSVTYQEANRWIEKKYGKNQGVSDATFYNTRKLVLANGNGKAASEAQLRQSNERVSVAVSSETSEAQSQATTEFSLTELSEIARFIRKVGGKDRLARGLAMLQELYIG
jgi:hypothetical protein